MQTVPDDVLVAAAEHLRELADHDAEMFGARLVRWWPDVAEGVRQVYEPDVAGEVGVRLAGLAAAAFASRATTTRASGTPKKAVLITMLPKGPYLDRFTAARDAARIAWKRK